MVYNIYRRLFVIKNSVDYIIIYKEISIKGNINLYNMIKMLHSKIFFILLLLFFFNINFVYPLKKPNPNIKIAENLLKEKKYNEASKILSEELVNDPDDEYKIMKMLDSINKERDKVISMIYDVKETMQKGEFEKADKLLSVLESSGDFDAKINNLISVLLKQKEPLKKIIQFNFFVINEAEKYLQSNDIKNAFLSYLKAMDIYRNENLSLKDPAFLSLIDKFNNLENNLKNTELEITYDMTDDNLNYEIINLSNEKFKGNLIKWKKIEDDFIDLSDSLRRLSDSTKKEIKYEAYNSITQKYIKLLRRCVQNYGNYFIAKIFPVINSDLTALENNDVNKISILNNSFNLLNNVEKEAFYNISVDLDNNFYITETGSIIGVYLNYITRKNNLILRFKQALATIDYNTSNKYYGDYLAKKTSKELQEAKNILLKSNELIPVIYKGSQVVASKILSYNGLKDDDMKNYDNKNTVLIKNTDELSNKIKNSLNEINDLLGYVNGLLSEADNAFDNSVNLFNQKSYSIANEKFGSAKEKYIDIRVLMKSEYVEKQILKIDDYLAKIEEISFKEDINNAEQYLESAKTNFYREKYDEAKNSIDEADKIYKKYNQNEDEINYYRERILSAIKIQSGSKLSIDDSAYNQIVELFKNAKINFEKNDYDKSYQFITQILLEKPYYEEARLFEIKILQKKDIKSFEQIYNNYYKRAVEKFNAKAYDDALLEFKQLLEFNMNKAEIENYIYKCKVNLNLTQPVITAEQKKSALDLIKQAQKYYADGDYKNAYDSINQALKLWEDVPEAKSIKLACMQKLKIERPKLTIDNELKFRDANKAYSENDYETAYKITSEILKTQDVEEVRKLNRKAELKIKNQ